MNLTKDKMAKREHNIHSLLPSGYRQLEYLESTGTQFINTNINTGVNGITIDLYTKLSDSYMFGFWSALSMFNMQAYSSHIIFTYDNSSSNYYQFQETELNGILEIKNNRKLYYNGTLCKTFNNYPQRQNSPFLLFAFRNQDENYNILGKGKIRYAILYDRYNNSIAHYIPALRILDSKPGLYDLVNNQFYTNAGTGDFLYA